MAKKRAKPKLPANANHSFEVGTCYLIRGVTMYYTGRLVRITQTDLVMEDAAWIADTGRFTTALRTGVLNEIEPFPLPVIIPRATIVDATEWTHSLPRDRK